MPFDLFGPTVEILIGDALETLRTLPARSVQTCVTSPPYFGLRDYGHTGQVGLEETPELYVARLVEIFREVRRVLRDDGTLWLNLGDSYAGSGKGAFHAPDEEKKRRGIKESYRPNVDPSKSKRIERGSGRWSDMPGPSVDNLPSKSLIGIPWRVAFALQDDGWILRQDIIWSKSNPMPESVTDRCTKAHEYLFMFSKSNRTLLYRAKDTGEWSRKPDLNEQYWRPDPTFETWKGSTFSDGKTAVHQGNRAQDHEARGGKLIPRWRGYDYFFDGEAIKEPAVWAPSRQSSEVERGPGYYAGKWAKLGTGNCNDQSFKAIRETRNKRSVWTVSTKPYKGAHFATFPPDLIEPCVLAGAPRGGIVLDPFAGSGTTGMVAKRHDREAILIELNPDYVPLIRERLK